MLKKLEDIDTPFLWVELDIMESNIVHLSSYFKSKCLQWGPHTKGIKIPVIAQRVIDSGAVGFTCAKLSEAEMIAEAGITKLWVSEKLNAFVNFRKNRMF